MTNTKKKMMLDLANNLWNTKLKPPIFTQWFDNNNLGNAMSKLLGIRI